MLLSRWGHCPLPGLCFLSCRVSVHTVRETVPSHCTNVAGSSASIDPGAGLARGEVGLLCCLGGWDRTWLEDWTRPTRPSGCPGVMASLFEPCFLIYEMGQESFSHRAVGKT